MKPGSAFTALMAMIALPQVALAATAPLQAQSHPRLFVISDIGNEPDDQMSLVRLLLYANEIDITGFAAATSVWQRTAIHPEIARDVIDGYGEVIANLRLHGTGWPDAAVLRARVVDGVAGYGMAAIHPDHPSAGALALLAQVQADDPRPLWVSLWGGANTLAEALAHARATLPPDRLAQVVAKLRVYAISDQDDAGPVLRREFPDLFMIVSPSSLDGGDYARATWTGISGDQYYRNGAGADFTTVSNAWLDANIRSKGPLGHHYPRHMFIMEGDTPSFLGLIPNGLMSQQGPGWGGWGGRYILRQPAGEPRPIWTQGGDSFMRVTSADSVNGVVSDQATIWRWRVAFQNDFAARMDWTIKPFAKANHPPKVGLRGLESAGQIVVRTKIGQRWSFDASASSDPDGDKLHYRWFAYPEAGFDGRGANPVLQLSHSGRAQVTVTATARCADAWLPLIPCPPGPRTAHLILAVTDSGKPALTRYKRILIEVNDEKPE